MCILGIIICINCVWGTNVKLFEISKYTHPSSESMELLKFLWETSLKIKGFWGEGPEPSWKNTPRLHFILAATSWEGLQKDQPTHWALPVFIPTDWPAVDGVCWNRSNWLLCDCPQKSCLIFLISPSTQYLWNIWRKSLTILDVELLLFPSLWLVHSHHGPEPLQLVLRAFRSPWELLSSAHTQPASTTGHCQVWLTASTTADPAGHCGSPAGTVITSTSPETYGDVCMGVVEEEAGGQ